MKPIFAKLLVATVLVSGPLARGHFVWLTATDDHRVELVFGESPAQRDYKLPDSIAAAGIWVAKDASDIAPAPTEAITSDDFVGLRGKEMGPSVGVFESKVEYGYFHGSKLTYHAKHLLSHDASAWSARSGKLDFEIFPTVNGDTLVIEIRWQSKPTAGKKVTLLGGDGKEIDHGSTDDAGRVEFASLPENQTLGVLVKHSVDEVGDWEGQKYKGAIHYATLSFCYAPAKEKSVSHYPNLPVPVSSFGGAVADDWLYVYSGHTGKPHEHSKENLSPSFQRLHLADGKAWEDLPAGPPLQGVPLVAAKQKLFRIGGLSSRNTKDQPEDMLSVASVGIFDPGTKTWSDGPALPAPRSSHDAALFNGSIYVTGGWQLDGKSQSWHGDLLRLNVEDTDEGWKVEGEVPFKRRAIALAAGIGKLFVIGGMDSSNKPSNRVDVYDPATKTWSTGPDLPGHPYMKGFGASAWGTPTEILVSGMDGHVYRLTAADQAWQVVHSIGEGRIFHRLLPGPRNEFLIVAGANGMKGHFADVLPLAQLENGPK